MESSSSSSSSSRKRVREDEANLQSKKQQDFFSISFPDEIDEYEFHDGIGVFEFPWLKEGVIFNSETAASFEDHEDKFAPTSYLQDSSSVAPDAASYLQNQNQNDKNVCEGKKNKKKKKKNEEDDSFWSLLVDDLEPLDCIWSSVIDQPLDVGFHKG